MGSHNTREEATMYKKAFLLVVAGIMLLTLSSPPSAQAIVPAFGFVIVGVGAAVFGTAAVVNETKKTDQQNTSVEEQKEEGEVKPVALEFQPSTG
jgi:hypothetical protein